MRERHIGQELAGPWAGGKAAMTSAMITAPPIRYCAISMELAAYLDDQYVEMHILTDTGRTISIVCEKDSIFSVQRHIERLGQDCPEIETWKTAAALRALRDIGHGSRAAGLAARPHRSPLLAHPMLTSTLEAGQTALRE